MCKCLVSSDFFVALFVAGVIPKASYPQLDTLAALEDDIPHVCLHKLNVLN